MNIAKLTVRHLGCNHGFLSIQYSKLPIKNLTNCIFRANCQIFDSLIIPRSYTVYCIVLNTVYIAIVLNTVYIAIVLNTVYIAIVLNTVYIAIVLNTVYIAIVLNTVYIAIALNTVYIVIVLNTVYIAIVLNTVYIAIVLNTVYIVIVLNTVYIAIVLNTVYIVIVLIVKLLNTHNILLAVRLLHLYSPLLHHTPTCWVYTGHCYTETLTPYKAYVLYLCMYSMHGLLWG